jgi:hypothetical protein
MFTGKRNPSLLETEVIRMAEKMQQLFTKFMESKPLFRNREVLTIAFSPEAIQHREQQMEELGRLLAPALKSGRPSNVFIYGKTGTGKSLVCGYVLIIQYRSFSNINAIAPVFAPYPHDTPHMRSDLVVEQVGYCWPRCGF